MLSVTLDVEEWNRVMALIAQAPWNVANPLLMKIGTQLRASGMNGQTAEGVNRQDDKSKTLQTE